MINSSVCTVALSPAVTSAWVFGAGVGVGLGLGRPSSVPVSAEGVLAVAGAVPLNRHRVVV